MDSIQKKLRAIPKTDDLLRDSRLVKASKESGHAPLLQVVRQELDEVRSRILAGEADVACDSESIISGILYRLSRAQLPSLRRVVNATGVILHTNLGRAGLCRQAADAVYNVATNYSTLEYDCFTGARGSRYSHVEGLLCRICGCEAAMVVNNNAAAVMLVLSTVARGGDVLVSRGELVEIGGSFRVPEIMEQSGCTLVEVGTTNKTHSSDYKAAVGEGTRALLKVHTSNYKILGFTQEVEAAELASIAHSFDLPMLYDLGSGALFDTSALGLAEPSVFDAVKSGADVISFSGDKLLGGPQAGIIIGKKEYIDKMKKSPLTRAFRIDKMTLAALEATLRVYLDPQMAMESIPLLGMLTTPRETLRSRANSLKRRIGSIPGAEIRVVEEESQVGGGSVPTQMLPSVALSIFSESIAVSSLEKALRTRDLPIIARISKNRLIFDMRTIRDGELSIIADAVKEVLARE